ncbi:MAG: sphingomyelinase family [Lasallia pustulata]|uniref:Sphingomyelinase family n=1 Tax=Lasallia pustulata TaxID=136370 RepID=A0A5M8PV28_9LECA|nr:MAG: sphingomyelinase family [Lasallia pustulata]
MSHQQELPQTINVLTLNCWGLKFLATLRKERLSEIGRRIATADPVPEIVGLQECWTQEDYQSIRTQTRNLLPHGKFYHSGIFGGGLAILSRWPIEESSMVRYPLNGRPTAFFRGDWFVGKGVACARIRIGPATHDVAEVFTTHLHAPYEREPHDSYICHRTAQAWEIAKLMRGAAERGHLVIALGDFNMTPSSLAYRLITAHAPVSDAWRVLHPASSLGAWNDAAERSRRQPMPSAAHNLAENGTTRPRPHPPSPHWRVRSAKVGMTAPHPALACSLSDHFSVEAVLARAPVPPGEKPRPVSPGSPPPPAPPLAPDAYAAILAMVATYTLRERRQRRLRLAHFAASVLVSVGCLAGVWWVRGNAVAFGLMLVSTLGLGAGVVDGMIGGLFVGSELRALREFEWEIGESKKAIIYPKTRFQPPDSAPIRGAHPSKKKR